VKAWFVWNCPHVFITPVQSSDLNVIENLWEIAIRKRKNKIDLLMEECQKVPVETTKKLVSSMRKRLKAVLGIQGHTKY